MGETPAGDVAAGTLAGNQPLSQRDPRINFGFKGLHALALLECKPVDHVIGKADVVFDLLRNRGDDLFLLLGRDDQVTRPAIEFLGQFTHRAFSPGLDILQEGGHGFAYVALAGLGGFGCLFDIGRHVVFSLIFFFGGFAKSPIAALRFSPRHCGVHKYASFLASLRPSLELFSKPSEISILQFHLPFSIKDPPAKGSIPVYLKANHKW